MRPRETLQNALALLASGHADRLVDACRKILLVKPNDVDALHFLGLARHFAGRYAEAVPLLERAARHGATRADIVNNLGRALESLGERDQAIACFRAAIRLRETFAEAHANLGNCLRESGALDDAIAAYHRALALRPDFAEVLSNCASALRDRGDLAGATAGYERALAHKPDLADARYNLALAQLASGDFASGWANHEARFQRLGASLPAGLPPAGRWSGEPIADQELVLVAEQGLGDTIQFTQLACRLAGTGVRPALRGATRLQRLLGSAGCYGRFLADGEPVDARCQRWLPIMSLAHITSLGPGDLPVATRYLHAEPERRLRWRARLPLSERLAVGIAWQGNPSAETGSLRGRSVPLAALAPVADVPGVSLISLQQGAGAEQLGSVGFRSSILALGPELDRDGEAFLDTAAVIASLDLVICSDSAVAHLAGALGVPVWVVLHDRADWRWLRERDDSPWYPAMRLFRQAQRAEWGPVVDEICAALHDLGARHRAQARSMDAGARP